MSGSHAMFSFILIFFMINGCTFRSEYSNTQRPTEPIVQGNTDSNLAVVEEKKFYQNYCIMAINFNVTSDSLKELVPYSKEWYSYQEKFGLTDTEKYFDKCITSLAVLRADPSVCGQSWFVQGYEMPLDQIGNTPQFDPFCEDYASGKEKLPTYNILDANQCLKEEVLSYQLNNKASEGLFQSQLIQCLLEASIKDKSACEILDERLKNNSNEDILWHEGGWTRRNEAFTALEFTKKEIIDLCYSLNKKEINSCKKYIDEEKANTYNAGLYAKCIYEMALVKWEELEGKTPFFEIPETPENKQINNNKFGTGTLCRASGFYDCLPEDACIGTGVYNVGALDCPAGTLCC